MWFWLSAMVNPCFTNSWRIKSTQIVGASYIFHLKGKQYCLAAFLAIFGVNVILVWNWRILGNQEHQKQKSIKQLHAIINSILQQEQCSFKSVIEQVNNHLTFYIFSLMESKHLIFFISCLFQRKLNVFLESGLMSMLQWIFQVEVIISILDFLIGQLDQIFL